MIDAVMDDIRRAHPLLDEITFMNTHGAIKMHGEQKGRADCRVGQKSQARSRQSWKARSTLWTPCC